MTKFAVLIDGGGTSSKAVAAPLDDLASGAMPADKFRVQHVNAPLNVVTIGPDAVKDSVRNVFSALKVPHQQISFVYCGLAGVDTPEIGERVTEDIKRIGVGPRRSPATVFVRNDIHIGLNAEHRDESRATGVLISGTGCNSAIEDRNGVLSQVGGTGFMLGDRGTSGSWLGGTALDWAIKQVQVLTDISKVRCDQLLAYGKRWKADTLLSRILETAHRIYSREIDDSPTRKQRMHPGFLNWAHAHTYIDGSLHLVPDASRVKFLGEFARPAIEAAKRRDRQALRWTEQIGENLAEIELLTVKKAQCVPDRVALVGGIIAPKGPVQSAFMERLDIALPERKPRFAMYADQRQLLIAALRGAVRRFGTFL